ncbi:MAG: hypothetical protein HZB46_18745 [Solirubrobacterales bacterium]|nr:hypothetical protein [Solirubrobacterales bacterium]
MTVLADVQGIETRRRLHGGTGGLPESAQMLGKPLLLVDVDGVISLFGFPPDERPSGTWATVDGIPHVLSTRAAELLRGLSSDFELIWCTGWEEKADEHLPHLVGMPRGLHHLTFERSPGRKHAHWKLDAIEAHAGDRPLAWVDDALDDACRAWAAARAAPTLLVATDPAKGLTEAEAAALRAFAADVAGRGPSRAA